jgi:hypothetical protein
MLSRKHRWLLVSGLAAAAASFLTRSVLKRGWNAATGDDPPVNPASAETAWTEALTWTVAASLVAGLTRLAARRAAASVLDGQPPHDRYG